MIGWLIFGTALVYLGIAGIADPLDNRITSIVGPYMLVALGLFLFFRSALTVFGAKGIKPYHQFAVVIAYPMMTLGVGLIFARWLIDGFWVRLLVGLGFLGVGLLIRMSITWGKKMSEN